MLSTVLIVLPIFALIVAGWAARKLALLGPHATAEINLFVVYFALPAVLIDIIVHAKWADLWQPAFVASFGLSGVIVFAIVLIGGLCLQRATPDAAIDAMNASYSNTGYIGLPLALVALGPEAMPATGMAAIITVCFFFAMGIVAVEVGLQAETPRLRLAWSVLRSLLRNPLVVGPAAAAIVPLAGIQLPAPANTFFRLLGGAASPCALFALGLFLVDERDTDARQTAATTTLIALKLVLQPIIAWALAHFVFRLSPMLTNTAVLMAALPTGTGPFMLAEFYNREAGITCRVVLLSTIVSVATLSAYLAFVG